MATLTVGNLDDAVVRRLRIRAAEHGRSAVLTDVEQPTRQQAAERLAEFRRRTAGGGTSSSAELLTETRTGTMVVVIPRAASAPPTAVSPGFGSLASQACDLKVRLERLGQETIKQETIK